MFIITFLTPGRGDNACVAHITTAVTAQLIWDFVRSCQKACLAKDCPHSAAWHGTNTPHPLMLIMKAKLESK